MYDIKWEAKITCALLAPFKKGSTGIGVPGQAWQWPRSLVEQGGDAGRDSPTSSDWPEQSRVPPPAWYWPVAGFRQYTGVQVGWKRRVFTPVCLSSLKTRGHSLPSPHPVCCSPAPTFISTRENITQLFPSTFQGYSFYGLFQIQGMYHFLTKQQR